jgi:hypothetical protein
VVSKLLESVRDSAEDYRKGLTHMVTNVRPSRAETVGGFTVLPSHAATNRGVLIKLNVPEHCSMVGGHKMGDLLRFNENAVGNISEERHDSKQYA